jgi:hypothetical protein
VLGLLSVSMRTPLWLPPCKVEFFVAHGVGDDLLVRGGALLDLDFLGDAGFLGDDGALFVDGNADDLVLERLRAASQPGGRRRGG